MRDEDHRLTRLFLGRFIIKLVNLSTLYHHYCEIVRLQKYADCIRYRVISLADIIASN